MIQSRQMINHVTEGVNMPVHEQFLSYEDQGVLWGRKPTGETVQIGITMKAFNAVKEALENVTSERDEYFETLIAAGLKERPKTPESIAQEALAAATSAQNDIASLTEMVAQQTNLIKQLVGQQKTEKSEPVQAKDAGGKK